MFILKPGQWVHINKGRLHAFRKMSCTKLPSHDCHYELRNKLIADENLTKDVTCVSIAWDWMYRGISVKGISEELKSTLDCAKKAKDNGRQSLAIPETALFRSAKNLISECCNEEDGFSLASTCIPVNETSKPLDVLTGIIPSLKKIVFQHTNAFNKIKGETSHTITNIPNSWENPDTFTLDPYGNGDFMCKICFCELSNVYMHCDGCEKLLNKDFNICTECFQNGKHLQNIQMHPQKNNRHAILNHTGGFKHDRQARCPCKRGPQCSTCCYCLGYDILSIHF